MRRYILNAVRAVICVSCLCAGANTQASPEPTPVPQVKAVPEVKTVMLWRGEKWMLDYTNWVRKRYGAGGLVIDPKLQESCRRHCAWMVRNHSMVHSSGSCENIAMGQNNVPHAMTTWEHSSGHFTNMVNRGHRFCGMACYQMPNGQKFYCQQFR